MNSLKQLYVFYDEHLVGEILLQQSEMKFSYRDEWLASETSFPISLSLPLTDVPAKPYVAHNYFANLLPEATVRQRICKKLKISPGNDFGLLAAIGGDCAGALTITPAPEPQTRPQSYRSISLKQLSEWSLGVTDVFSDVTGQDGIRLSLAGAQDKLPVHVKDDQFFLPEGDAPSTSLLKFASPFYSHLPENETWITMLAQAVGLPTVSLRLQSTDESRITVIERYDRFSENGKWKRLHQEDLCQVLGISPMNKYEKEGGPQVEDCCREIREHCVLPAIEIDKFLNWMIFNLLVGNSDAHGKNVSFLFQRGGGVVLAPFYDLVCTRNYENLDRHLAMSIGGESDPGQVAGKHLRKQAEILGVRTAMLLSSVKSLADKVVAQLPLVNEEFASAYGESPILERLPKIITQQVRRTLRNVTETGG